MFVYTFASPKREEFQTIVWIPSVLTLETTTYFFHQKEYIFLRHWKLTNDKSLGSQLNQLIGFSEAMSQEWECKIIEGKNWLNGGTK